MRKQHLCRRTFSLIIAGHKGRFVVIHGKAVNDVTKSTHYEEAVGGENANAPMLAALMEKGVRVIVCGQSAAYYEVENEELLPGVEMALSAMTAHAVLQQQGYTLNPF